MVVKFNLLGTTRYLTVVERKHVRKLPDMSKSTVKMLVQLMTSTRPVQV